MPTGGDWTYAGLSGIASNGSGFGNPPAPEGDQVGLLQAHGSMTQTVEVTETGSYVLEFRAAQRAGTGSNQLLQFSVDGVDVASVRPVGTAFRSYVTAPFFLAAGTHQVKLRGGGSGGGNDTAFLDAVRIARRDPDTVRTQTAYDGLNPYADFDGQGTLRTRYLHGPAVDWLLARSDATNETDWYLTDRLGSVRILVDDAGTPLNHLSYDAYGQLTGESVPAAGDRFGYTGREREPITHEQFNRGRYYDAVIGRWTQEDPIGFAGGDANLYRYVGNAPTNFTDADGLRGTPAPGGYRWGGYNPLNWPRWAYTNDPNAPDEYYDAAWEGLGQGYTQAYDEVAPQASYVLAGASFVKGPVGWLASGTDVALATILNPSIEPAPQGSPRLAIITPRRRPVVIIQRPAPLAQRVAARANVRNAKTCPTPAPNAGRPSVGTSLPGRVTGELPPGAGRTKAELKQARNFFERNRDAARRWWEQRTGRQWPGNATHYEHPRPLKDGGDPLFVKPGFNGPNSPHMVPGPDGLTDFQRWGQMGGRPKAN